MVVLRVDHGRPIVSMRRGDLRVAPAKSQRDGHVHRSRVRAASAAAALHTATPPSTPFRVREVAFERAAHSLAHA